MLAVFVRDAGHWRSGGTGCQRRLPRPGVGLGGEFQASFDRPDRVEVLVELEQIVAAQSATKIAGVLQRQIEQAAVVVSSASGVFGTEQAFVYHARIDLLGQRCPGSAPGDV